MHTAPPTEHAGVAAFAVPVAPALTPPTMVSAATAASTCLLIDSSCVADEVMTDLLPEDLRLWLVTGSPASSGPKGRTARPTGRVRTAAPRARRSRSARGRPSRRGTP